jgi:hypothetical protein
VTRSNDDMLPRPSLEGRKVQSCPSPLLTEERSEMASDNEACRYVYLSERRNECKTVGRKESD